MSLQFSDAGRPPGRTRRRAGSAARIGTVTAVSAALVVTLGGIVAPAAQADDAPAGGTFASSFEKSDAAPLLSTAFSDPVNVSGVRYANGSLLPHVTGVTASAENPPSETAVKAADADSSTKWLVRSATGWLRYQLDAAQTVKQYTLTSGNDSAGRDPKAWTVQGSTDGTTWVDLDSQTGQSFSDRGVTNTYTVAKPGAYAYYRLNITQNNGDSLMQLAGWDVLDGSDVPTPAGPIRTEVGSGPVSSPTAKTNAGFSGTQALRYSGSHLADGKASSTDTLYQDVDIAVGSDSELSYTVFPTMNPSDLEYPATYVAVDLQLDDGTLMSAKGLTDQYGFGADAKDQGSEKALYADQWNKVRVDLSSLAGRHVTKVLLSYDNPGGSAKTSFSGWLDDVKIQHATTIDGSSRTNFVDTRRGTNASGSFSRGNNIPATAVPNGFNFFTPMTDGQSNSWLYNYASSNDAKNLPVLQAIGISHEPSPWMGDRNQLAIMPSLATGTPDAGLSARGLEFSHDDETAQPDLYSVKFTDGIKAEVTPSDHAGVYRFTFPSGAATGTAIVDQVSGTSSLKVAADGTVSGWVDGGSGLSAGASRMFVYGQFDRAPSAVGTATGRTTAQFARFDTASDSSVELRISTSFISLDQAKHSLALEVAGQSFDQVRGAAQKLWNDRLGVIDVPSATQAQKVNLYSDLYRLNLYPNSQSENTGTAADPTWQYASPVSAKSGTASDTATNAKVVDGKIFVNNGFWDTYRTVWPLYSFLYPDVATELVDGFVQQYRDGGWIARWSSPGYADLMTGTSSDASFAEAYLSGAIPTDLALEAYDAAVKNATVLPTSNAVGRKGLDTSEFIGYTSNATGESVSWGLEGYVNDFAIGKMAAKLAADPATPQARVAELTQEASYFTKRATNYVNMFDPAVNFFQGKTPAGAFAKDASTYDPTQWGGDYTETDGWNFAFHAPYDIDGLAALYGGTDGLLKKLDTFFSTPEKGSYGIHEAKEARDVRMGQLGMSNQVSHHIPYLYAAAGEPSKTQAAVREITQRLFVGSEIGQGYPGDEDNGEMSSWYVFSALGFYPLALGSGQYTIGSPLYKDATVHLKGGDLKIEAPDNSKQNVYVKSVDLDGKALDGVNLDESALAGGGTLTFDMSATPTSWGERTSDAAVRTPEVDGTKASYGDTVATDGTDVGALVDDNSRSAVTFASATPSVTWSSTSGPVAVASYTLTNGAGGSVPTAWTLEGSNDGQSWTMLDTRTDQKFAWATQTRPFTVAKPTLYAQYRLHVTATSDGSAPTLAELELLVDTTVQSDAFALYPAKKLAGKVGTSFTGAYATVTGGTSSDPKDFSATVDFLDGEGPQAATVTRSALGAMQITAPHTFDKAGVYTARVWVKQGDKQASEPVTLTVSRDDSLVGAYSITCFTTLGAGISGDCDGNGYTFDAASLAGKGYVPGTTVAVPGTALTFDLPKVAAGKPDTAVAKGQRIALDLGTGATKLSVIGTANENAQHGTATLTFTDGTTQDLAIDYGDWVGAAKSPQFGNIAVALSDDRLKGSGAGDNQAAAVFSTAPVDIPAGKTVESITLPNQENGLGDGLIHVVAVASDGQRTAHTAIAAAGADVAQQATGEAFTATLATVTGGLGGADTATVNWGDETPVGAAEVADGKVTGTHTYAQPGTYTVSVTVDDGEKSVVATTKVVVKDVYHAALTVTPAKVHPGDAVTIKGTGFKPGETVDVTLSATPVATSARSLAATPGVTADEHGSFSTTRTIPAKADDGTYPVLAVGRDSEASASAVVVVEHAKKASSVTLTASPTKVAFGNPVKLTATVTNRATGAVEFFDGTTSLGLVSIVGHKARLTLDTVPVGTHAFTARYAGDDVYTGSSSGTVKVTVAKAHAAVGVPAFSKPSQVYGSSKVAAVTAWVTGATSGTVTFRSGSTVLGTAKVERSGWGYKATATLSSTLRPGTYRSTVAVLGETSTTDGAVSPGSRTPFTVTKPTTSVRVTGSSFRTGAHPTVAVTVAKVSDGSWPVGSVAVQVDGRTVTTAALKASAQGRLTVTLPKTYTSSITVRAVFTPSSSYVEGATSPTVRITPHR
ncbi:GH92 family glycosyl hydrolase [Luteimicrobium sp. DT211]|uniref:GH92 family glycosyl hydrolase n=1 Tax=Luteimicrobium sp. DT211 TaxID=3393412 RepID=UPI003CED9182